MSRKRPMGSSRARSICWLRPSSLSFVAGFVPPIQLVSIHTSALLVDRFICGHRLAKERPREKPHPLASKRQNKRSNGTDSAKHATQTRPVSCVSIRLLVARPKAEWKLPRHPCRLLLLLLLLLLPLLRPNKSNSPSKSNAWKPKWNDSVWKTKSNRWKPP